MFIDWTRAHPRRPAHPPRFAWIWGPSAGLQSRHLFVHLINSWQENFGPRPLWSWKAPSSVLVRKCLSLKRKFIHRIKESGPMKKPDPEMKGVEQLQVKQLKNILAPSGALAFVTKKDWWILKYLAWHLKFLSLELSDGKSSKSQYRSYYIGGVYIWMSDCVVVMVDNFKTKIILSSCFKTRLDGCIQDVSKYNSFLTFDCMWKQLFTT